jgi:hypothetical protein
MPGMMQPLWHSQLTPAFSELVLYLRQVNDSRGQSQHLVQCACCSIYEEGQ